MKKALFILALILFFGGRVHGACSGASPLWTAASASDSDINACIAVASSGDTILVPAGTVAFAAAVTISSAKCLTINGQGAVTVTSPTGFVVNGSATCLSRVTGFTFTGGSSGPPSTATNVTVLGNPYAVRIDHNTFTATGTQIYVVITSIGSAGQTYPALLDHNTFNCGYTINNACEAVHSEGTNNEPLQIGWTNTVIPGGPSMVFLEDNTFNQTGGNGGNQISAVEQFYGAQTVIRHNTMNNCAQLDAHGTPNQTGARWWEIYNNRTNFNSFSCPDAMQLRGGTGVVFNNSTDGTSTNSTPCGSSTPCFIDIFNENGSSATWPNMWQVGSGINGNTNSHVSCPGPLNNAPAQLWNNTNLPIGTGGGVAGTILVNRDYFTATSQPATINWEEAPSDTCSTTYNYVPYTYPHPLVNSGSTFPAANNTIDWTHAGIPGGIPDANWPICQTIPPSGGPDDSVTIQNALNTCAAGTVVLLTAGTYTLHRTTGVVCPSKPDDGGGGVYESGLCVTDKSIALRGAGPQSTIINYGDGANIISIGQTFLSHSSITFTAITSAATKGATTITVASVPTGVVVNSFIVISQTNPNDADGNPLVQIGGYGGSCSYCGHDLPNNAMDQIDQVTAVNGTTLTLARPLYWTYTNAPVMYHLPMVQSAGVENLRVVGTAASGTALQYKNINMEACAFCWIHNVESDFAVDVSNFYGSDVYAGEISNNYAYEAFNHNAGADYSLFLQFRASEMLVQNNIIRRARHSTLMQGTAGNVFIYNYLINSYEGENHNFLAETQLHAPEPYMNLWEGNVMSNAEFGDFAHGSSNSDTFFRNYVNLTSINPDNNQPMTSGLIAMNVAYYSNYENIVGNALGQYTGTCGASTYETDASTTKVNGVIWQLGYFDDGGGSTPNQALSNKVGGTLTRGGNWDCVTKTVVWNNNIPSGSPSQLSYLVPQALPNSLVFSSAPTYFGATGAVWPPINTAATTIVNSIPAQICYNAPGGPATSAGGNFNPATCYGAGSVTISPATISIGSIPQGTLSGWTTASVTNGTSSTITFTGYSFTGTNAADFLASAAYNNTGVWTPSTTWTAGQFIVDSNGNVQTVTTAGAGSTGAHPTWATVLGQVTTDGAAKWNMIGPYPGGCGATLAPFSSCNIVVAFQPSSSAAESATLNANFSGGSATASVSGTGTLNFVVPNLPVAPTQVNLPLNIISNAVTPYLATLNQGLLVPATTYTVCELGCNFTGAQLQSALNQAFADCATKTSLVQLFNTETISTSTGFTIGDGTRGCASGKYLRFETNHPELIPPDGVRISHSYAGVMPQIVTSAPSNYAIQLAHNMSGFEMRGIGFSTSPSVVTQSNFTFRCSDENVTATASIPTNIILDQNVFWASGVTGNLSRSAILADCNNIAVIWNDIENYQYTSTDNQAILMFCNNGPGLITGNTFSATTENVDFGGNGCAITDGGLSGNPFPVPSNVTITSNFVFKPLRWRSTNCGATTGQCGPGFSYVNLVPQPTTASCTAGQCQVNVSFFVNSQRPDIHPFDNAVLANCANTLFNGTYAVLQSPLPTNGANPFTFSVVNTSLNSTNAPNGTTTTGCTISGFFDPQYVPPADGAFQYDVKNLYEMKEGVNFLVQGNWFATTWQGSQAEMLILQEANPVLATANYSAWDQTGNVRVTTNTWDNADANGYGLDMWTALNSMITGGGAGSSLGTTGPLQFDNNFVKGLGPEFTYYEEWGSHGNPATPLANGQLADVFFNHDTVLQSSVNPGLGTFDVFQFNAPNNLPPGQTPFLRNAVDNSILDFGQILNAVVAYPFAGQKCQTNSATVPCFTPAAWAANIPVGTIAGSSIPSGCTNVVNLASFEPNAGPAGTSNTFCPTANIQAVGLANTYLLTGGNPISPGIATVAPNSMANIVPGIYLIVGSSTNGEYVYVVSTTSTTFTANFHNAHNSQITTVLGTVPPVSSTAHANAVDGLDVGANTAAVIAMTSWVPSGIPPTVSTRAPATVLFGKGETNEKDHLYSRLAHLFILDRKSLGANR